MLHRIKGRTAAAAVTVAGSFLTLPAFAQVSYAPLTEAVDWSSVSTALLTIGGALIAVLVVRKGVRMVSGMVK